MPNLIGMTEDQARAAIGDAGLAVDAPDFQPDEHAAAGTVTDQDPNRDQYVDPGTSVHLTISSGLPQVEVPFLKGSNQDEARNRLRNAKLKPEFKSVESDEPQGQVLETAPEGGTQVDQNSTVTVTISKGPHLVPNVVGLNRADAIQQIVDAGFAYDIRGDDKSTEPRGTVTDQLPPRRSAAAAGHDHRAFRVDVRAPTTAAADRDPDGEPDRAAHATRNAADGGTVCEPCRLLSPSASVPRSREPARADRSGSRTTGRAGRRTPAP